MWFQDVVKAPVKTGMVGKVPDTLKCRKQDALDSLPTARSFSSALHGIPSRKKWSGHLPGNALDNTYVFMYSLKRRDLL